MGSVLAAVLVATTACGASTTAAIAPPSPVAEVTASQTATSAPEDADDTAPLDSDVVPAAGAADLAANEQPAFATTALSLLATLPIKGRAPKTGYSRAEFGQAWADVDRNGCDTRNDILARDLTDKTFKPGSRNCIVASGILSDPYTASTIVFTRGQTSSMAVQIDHVVALNDAWQKGAQQLSLEQRTALANDPLNLLAVDGPTNQAKGAGDAATWLPANKAYRCDYVARQISVKATYKLWVTAAESDAMKTVLGSCAGALAPTNQKAPVTKAPAPAPKPVAPAPVAPAPVEAPVVAPAPVVQAPVDQAPAPEESFVFYQNCAAARAAGAAPIMAGQPGYSRKLDRDGDGIACE